MAGASRPAVLAGLPLLEDLPDVSGKRVLVRVDYNVPLNRLHDGSAVVADDFRMRAGLPTLRWLLDAGAQVTACSHLGRPSGERDPRWEMGPVRERLAELCPGVELTDNLRFDPGEKSCDPAFVAALLEGHDAYVNEAFGVSHRAHASVVGPPRSLPSAAGRRLAQEVLELGSLLADPPRPFVAVIGGAKVADKMGVLEALGRRVDTLAIGGAMAFTFLAALGHEVGSSILDVDRIEECRRFLRSGVNVLLPTDVVALEPGGAWGPESTSGPRGEAKTLGADLPDGWVGLDVGPDTAAAFSQAVAGAASILWNGPLGVFEDERFMGGTAALAEAVARSAGHTVVGGGDSVRALDELGLADHIDFLSTGGGASLEYIEQGDLPGLEALRHAPNAPAAGA